MGSKLNLLHAIPEEIITDILVLLPVESLTRFKCVSKAFKSLISNPNFIKYHIQTSSQKMKKEGKHKIMMFSNVTKHLIRSFTSSVKLLVLEKCHEDVKITNNKLEIDTSDLFPIYSRLVGCFNGLCCIETCFDIFVWNPSIRKLKHVEDLPHRADSRLGSLGFAYDESTDDYRVVELRATRFDSLMSDYSLKMDSWKLISDDSYIDGEVVSNTCPFLNGNLHWLLEKYHTTLIVLSYNLQTKTLCEIMLPHHNEGVGNGFEPVTLGVLRGCLCMVLWFDYSIVIWTMNDYGIHESWSKVVSYLGEQRLSWNSLMWSSVGHEDDDDILLSSSQGLGLFRVKDGIMKEHRCWKDYSCFDEVREFRFTNYIESLVSPT